MRTVALAMVACGATVNIAFFFIDTASAAIYTLSLHDALPISASPASACCSVYCARTGIALSRDWNVGTRSEEHTSELQSHVNLVCRLLLEKKNWRRRTLPSLSPSTWRRPGGPSVSSPRASSGE